MPAIPGGNPMALGLVTVAASGTPVTILQNFTAVDTAAERKTNTISGRLAAKSILVQANPANADLGYAAASYIYVGKANMDIATGVGVMAVLAPGQYISISDPAMPGNTFNLGDFFLDAADADGSAYVTAIRS